MKQTSQIKVEQYIQVYTHIEVSLSNNEDHTLQVPIFIWTYISDVTFLFRYLNRKHEPHAWF